LVTSCLFEGWGKLDTYIGEKLEMPSEAIADLVGTRENIRKAHCEGNESGQMNKQRPFKGWGGYAGETIVWHG